MLQQTQVSTVVPYYNRWLKTFPSLGALARAPLSKALRLWSGLGYYRRARMFHQAAQFVQKNLSGKIPATAKELAKLPGIGRYTAGAIASIALSEKTPVLDGNVIRILTRIFALKESVDLPATQEKLWSLAESLLPDKNPGDFNQALMELGATICFPSTPQCSHCPVQRTCLAHKKNTPLAYPARSRKENYEKKRMMTMVLRNNKNQVWIEKQPLKGRWGGLWLFPFWDHKEKMLNELGLQGKRPKPSMIVQHAFTKYRIKLEVYLLLWKSPAPKNRLGKWLSLSQLLHTAMAAPHRKIAHALLEGKIS